MKRVAVLMVAVLVVPACGGSDGGGALSVEGWCDFAQQIEDASDAADAVDETDPAAFRSATEKLQGLLNEGAEKAPEAILAEVNTNTEIINEAVSALDDADYDVDSISEEQLDALTERSDELGDATAAIEAYNERECGIVADPVIDDPDPTDGESADDATFSGDSDSDWCNASRDIDVLGDDFDNVDFTNPEAVRDVYLTMNDAIRDAAPLAPPELADAVDTTLDGFDQLNDVLADVDYDILNADLAIIDELDAEMQAASDTIDAYNAEVCGIPIDTGDDGDDDSAFDPSAGTIRDQAVGELVNQGFTQEEAECIFDKLDLSDPNLGEDPNEMLVIFEECGIGLERLAELGGTVGG